MGTPYPKEQMHRIAYTKLTPQQIAAQGGNRSLIHIDWMIGSDQTDIDGIHVDGRRVPVFRKGEWA